LNSQGFFFISSGAINHLTEFNYKKDIFSNPLSKMTVGIVNVLLMTFSVVVSAAAEARSSQIAPTNANLLATTFVGSGYIFKGQYSDNTCQTLTSATANVLNFCSSYGTGGEFFKVP
jgi:hypothetical protein